MFFAQVLKPTQVVLHAKKMPLCLHFVGFFLIFVLVAHKLAVFKANASRANSSHAQRICRIKNNDNINE